MPRLSLPEDTAPRAEVRIRRPSGRRSHGAWKVAYADFVTALMALFIVLWLMNSSQKVKASVGGYFTDPRGFTRTLGARPASNSGEGLVVDRNNMGDIRKQMEDALKAIPDFSKLRNNVKFSVTGEGLRIDLLETEQGMFFVSGSPAPTAAGQNLLRVLAIEMARLPNVLVIEGHTDSKPFRNAGPATGYSNWELASDRANAARRLLHSYGVRPEQVVEVRGYADQRPFNEKDRYDTRNRRVSVVVRFTA
ncbi:MAG: OmpA family protein [Candidatus Solibacter sp.]|nr:OmpA family protein [Candidatus Solibacter sp.]